MAVKTKKPKTEAPKNEATKQAAATIGTGNPGIAATNAEDMDAFLAGAGVSTKAETKKKSSDIPAVSLDLTHEVKAEQVTFESLVESLTRMGWTVKTETLPDGSVSLKAKPSGSPTPNTVHRNVIDLVVEAIRRRKAAGAEEELYRGLAHDSCEQLRVAKARADGQFYSSVYVHGDKEMVTYVTVTPGSSKPSEKRTKAAMIAALESQFGPQWRDYVKVESKLVIAKGVTVALLSKVAAAIKEKGLNFGELVQEEVEFTPTELLHHQETLDPAIAAKVETLVAAEVLKKKTAYIKGQ